MDRTVECIMVDAPAKTNIKRVAAYCRVSSGKDAMLHSLSTQVSYYSGLIQNHADWSYCGVYSDEAITGTKSDRPGFQRMLKDCEAGKIDLILTKSISRFSRNTVTFLQTIRKLKSIGIDVFFEEQNIHSIDGSGELMTTILSSFAQEESHSVSQNMKWRIKKNFEEGIPWNNALLGYRLKGDRYELIPEEADTVRRIFREYLSGFGKTKIANGLTADGIPTRFGGPWHPNTVGKILRNETYTGNLLLQKTFIEDHITKKKRINNGERPKYLVESSHEAIIPPETFKAVQKELQKRSKMYCHASKKSASYPFTGLLICAGCGKTYTRKITPTGAVWICRTFNTRGKAYCPSKQIPEATLYEVTGQITASIKEIRQITVCNGNSLQYNMADGRIINQVWKDRSRSESWTDEKRAAASQQLKKRRKADE